MCLRSSSGLESAILNLYFWSGRKVFPLCHLDTIVKDLSNVVLHAILFVVLGINVGGMVTITPHGTQRRKIG